MAFRYFIKLCTDKCWRLIRWTYSCWVSRLLREAPLSVELPCSRWHHLVHRELGKNRILPSQFSRFPLWQARVIPHHGVYSRLFTAEELIIEWVVVVVILIITYKVKNFSPPLLLTVTKFHFSMAPFSFSVIQSCYILQVCVIYFFAHIPGGVFLTRRITQDKIDSLRALNFVTWELKNLVV